MAKRRRGLARRILRGMLLATAAWLGVTIAVVLAFRWIDPPFTMFMLSDRIGAALTREKAYDFSHDWVAWERISKQAALAVVAAEDQQFPNHGGFDFKQIDKALADRERGRRVRGASTISQQVAKNIFLWRGQSWVRKGLEAGITVLIEFAWPKRRILEVYLNIAELGPGTYGAEAAAQRFFHKPAKKLTRAQSALLAATLPNPARYRADRPGPFVKRRQAWILRQMNHLGGAEYIRHVEEEE
jgi:monofunctional biosynthetic peptidoglycan transglycosylase